METAKMDESFWNGIRDEFRLDPDVLHFGAFWLSSYPASVREAIDRHRAGLDRNPVFYVIDNEERLEREARDAIAGLVGGTQDHVVLTESATEGLILAIGGLALGQGDEILITEHEHYSAQSAAARLKDRVGASLREIRLYDEPRYANSDAVFDQIVDEIRPETKAIVLTWVHSGTGVKIPLKRIVRHINEVNATRSEADHLFLCVDGTHGFGLLQIDFEIAGCDIFVSSCHKWLNGPHGTGFVHFSELAAERTQWLVPSFAPGPLGRFTGRYPPHEGAWERLTPGGFHAFENRWAIPAAANFNAQIGQSLIQERICELSSRMKAAIGAIDGVRLITPVSRVESAGIVCFEVDGFSPAEVVTGLRHRSVVASVSPYKVPYARLTPSIYNGIAEIDQLAERLEDISRRLERQPI
jgi:isopenicillin-N epimerase